MNRNPEAKKYRGGQRHRLENDIMATLDNQSQATHAERMSVVVVSVDPFARGFVRAQDAADGTQGAGPFRRGRDRGHPAGAHGDAAGGKPSATAQLPGECAPPPRPPSEAKWMARTSFAPSCMRGARGRTARQTPRIGVPPLHD